MSYLQPYSMGLVYASVCTDLPREQVAARMDIEWPSGASNGWHVADEPFRTGEPNPNPCNHDPDNRFHYLLTC